MDGLETKSVLDRAAVLPSATQIKRWLWQGPARIIFSAFLVLAAGLLYTVFPIFRLHNILFICVLLGLFILAVWGFEDWLARVSTHPREKPRVASSSSLGVTTLTNMGDTYSEADTYFQLGLLADKRRDFAAADKLYRKFLAISKRSGNKQGVAAAYGQLGDLALARRDFIAADKLYRRLLAISKRLANEQGVTAAYHQLGDVAVARRDFTTAEKWYRKCLVASERLSDEHGAAMAHHWLGSLALKLCNFAAAYKLYWKFLEINERLGNKQGVAEAYYHLGDVALACNNFTTAEDWYCKCLTIAERLDDEYLLARTSHQLGRLAEERESWVEAGKWFLKSIRLLRKNDPDNAGIAVKSCLRVYRKAHLAEKTLLELIWAKAGLGSLAELEHSMEQSHEDFVSRPLPLKNARNEPTHRK